MVAGTLTLATLTGASCSSAATDGSKSADGAPTSAASAVDIGASDAYLSEGDLTAHQGLTNIALVVSARQVSYKLPGLTDNLRLNGKVLSAMYQGTVKTWNDPAR